MRRLDDVLTQVTGLQRFDTEPECWRSFESQLLHLGALTLSGHAEVMPTSSARCSRLSRIQAMVSQQLHFDTGEPLPAEEAEKDMIWPAGRVLPSVEDLTAGDKDRIRSIGVW